MNFQYRTGTTEQKPPPPQGTERLHRMLRHTYLLVIGLVLLAAGVVAAVFYIQSRPTHLKIAVGPRGGDDIRLVQALSQHLARERAKVRLHVVRKETGGNYESVSAGGLYRGAYQMSKALAIGAAWMMLDEVRKDFGADAASTVEQLRSTPVQQWNRYWQDRAFWTIWRNGAGSDHWRVRGC